MELTAEQQAALQTTSLSRQMPSAHLRDVTRLVRERGLSVNPILLQKNHFVCVMLPIAIRMNAQVYRQRIEVLRLQAASERNEVTTEETAWLTSLRQSYGLSASANFTEILARVDVVPVSLLLAQAAKETAWGTSRSMEQTNNLYGRRGAQGEACVSVVANGPCLKRYASIVESLADQIFHLNTGDQAYLRRYRDLRARMRREGTALNAVELAETLDGYSQQGRAYVVDLRKIMSEWNQLVKYEFRETSTPPARMQPTRREDPQP
jgi:Bax protein